MNELAAQLTALSATTFLVVEIFVRALDTIGIGKSSTRSLLIVMVAVLIGSLVAYTSPEYLELFESTALEPYPWFVALLGGLGIGTGAKGINLVVDIFELLKKWFGTKIIENNLTIAERASGED